MSWSRRQVLRAAGATVALPFLASALPRRAWGVEVTPPVRLLFFYVPNGVRMAHWRPQGVGADFVLGPTMASLQDVRDDILVISGLANQGGRDDRPGDHARGTGAFLTCQRPAFEGISAGVSVDQIAAQALGDRTAFRSLELGVEGGGSVGFCDSGYACAYTQNISWADAQTPLPKLTNPQTVFDRLFAGGNVAATAEGQARRLRYRSSVLDLVQDQANGLMGKLAADDKQRMDAYLTGVRELERRLAGSNGCGPSFGLPEDPLLAERAELMLDIAVAAFSCDLTRFATFMLANAGSNAVYSFLPGVSGAHHGLSHHQDIPANLDQLSIIDAWEVSLLGRLIRRLRDEDGGDGSSSLLDHTAVVFSSEISDGNRHNHDDLPVIIAGRAGGAIHTGRHVEAPDTPIANLYLSLLGAVGLPQPAFGLDGSGPLAGLTT